MSYRDDQLNEYLENGTRCDTIPLHDRSVSSLFDEHFPVERKPGKWVGDEGGFQVWAEGDCNE